MKGFTWCLVHIQLLPRRYAHLPLHPVQSLPWVFKDE